MTRSCPAGARIQSASRTLRNAVDFCLSRAYPRPLKVFFPCQAAVLPEVSSVSMLWMASSTSSVTCSAGSNPLHGMRQILKTVCTHTSHVRAATCKYLVMVALPLDALGVNVALYIRQGKAPVSHQGICSLIPALRNMIFNSLLMWSVHGGVAVPCPIPAPSADADWPHSLRSAPHHVPGPPPTPTRFTGFD